VRLYEVKHSGGQHYVEDNYEIISIDAVGCKFLVNNILIFRGVCFRWFQFVVAAIFRDIHIWPVENASPNSFTSCFLNKAVKDAPIALLRAPIGIVSDLFVTNGGDVVETDKLVSIIGNDSSSTLLDIWNIGVAMTTPKAAVVASSRDRLTASIRDVTLTENDSHAFIQTNGSDEMGVYDMSSGQMVDLMTHEGVVAEYSISSNGRYMLVSLEHAKPGQFNKVSFVSW